MERMRANGPSIDDKEIRVIRPRGPRPPGGYIRKPLHNYEHFKIWNDNFIAHVDLYPEETYAREALEVYEKAMRRSDWLRRCGFLMTEWRMTSTF